MLVILAESSKFSLVSVWILVILVLAALAVLGNIFSSPFRYPYFTHVFDVSGKRNVDLRFLVDKFLMDESHFDEMRRHREDVVRRWSRACEERVSRSLFKSVRWNQYRRARDDAHEFRFSMSRTRTRYRQKNYVRTSYQVSEECGVLAMGWDQVVGRRRELKASGFDAVVRKDFAKRQRSMMTRELRERIMRRDNYTCKLCGKHMPDEVGLQIDHIVPVAKGGRTVPSNLQVLCDRCNRQKGSK